MLTCSALAKLGDGTTAVVADHERGIKFVNVWNERRAASGEDMIEENGEEEVDGEEHGAVCGLRSACLGIGRSCSDRSTLFMPGPSLWWDGGAELSKDVYEEVEV